MMLADMEYFTLGPLDSKKDIPGIKDVGWLIQILVLSEWTKNHGKRGPTFTGVIFHFIYYIRSRVRCGNPCCHWERRSLVCGELLQKAHASRSGAQPSFQCHTIRVACTPEP